MICEKKGYTQELVFIFSRMGDNKRALSLIIDKLENVEMAVDFVRQVGDEDLWNDLVEQAKSKPGIAHYFLSRCWWLNRSFHKGIAGTCGEYS